MQMFINNFYKENLWLDFIKKYESLKLNSVVADESIWPYIIGSFLLHYRFPLFILTSTLDRVNELTKELKSLLKNFEIYYYPVLGSDVFYKNKTVNTDNLSLRLEIIKRIMEFREGDKPFIIITNSSSIINLIPRSKIKFQENLNIKVNNSFSREELISNLTKNGYERVNKVYDKGEFSVKGDVVDIFDISSEFPIRLDLAEDLIKKIIIYSIENTSLIKNIDEYTIFPNSNPWDIGNSKTLAGSEMITIIDLMKEYIGSFGFIECDPVEINLKIKSDIDILKKSYEEEKEILNFYITKSNFIQEENFNFKLSLMSSVVEVVDNTTFIFDGISRQKKSRGNSEIFIENLKEDLKNKKTTIISLDNESRRKKIEEILLDNGTTFKDYFIDVNLESTQDFDFKILKPGIVNILNLKLLRGYESDSTSLYGELDIYEQLEYSLKDEIKLFDRDFDDFKPGDYVVHKTHGLGRYIEIVSEQINGFKKEYFLIEYANNDKLYVPTWQADRIHKYIGDKNPVVTTLNSKQWDNLKRKVRNSVYNLAIDLAKLYAERNSLEGYSFPDDDVWQKEMEDLFPFNETEDQLKAISYVKDEMKKPKPMDMLVCGDVGFGKTEVAIRAAFKAIGNGKQVLMLVPTTILADQHYRTFNERYKNFPVIVDVISRFRTKKLQREVLNNFQDGKIDMLIGTHRILSDDIKPKNLGLIIIDEEQRFGVNSKEKLKLLRKDADVLTLTATPIPRTLYMSLSGIRDMVLIETHPIGRFPIETFVGEKDNFVIRIAVDREVKRGGQVYYVYNRINGIEEKKQKLQALLPGIKIALTHGQMDGRVIERIMQDFLNKKYDILLTTSIIESGMDISNVNTLIVEDSHRFGLAQLYQLRGRVGRSSEKAYAYFFYPDRRYLNLQAFQRLKTLTEYTDLGSGYKIAMRDLEIRGTGELLGARQHGHINSVGFDMYCQIIRDEVEKLKGNEVEEDINIQIELPVSAYIPKNYIRNEKERINIYKNLGNIKSESDIENIVSKLNERYGNIPLVAMNLISIARIKYLLKKAGIEKILFAANRGVVIKKVNIPPEKVERMNLKNNNVVYIPKNREILIKNTIKNLELGLVISSLNDIIGFI